MTVITSPRVSSSGYPASKVTGGIHALMQDSDDGDAVARRPKIDDMLFDSATAIAWPNAGAVLRAQWGLRKIGAGGFDQVGVAQGLRQAPLGHGVIEHPIGLAAPSD